jgi:hypothetical protein
MGDIRRACFFFQSGIRNQRIGQDVTQVVFTGTSGSCHEAEKSPRFFKPFIIRLSQTGSEQWTGFAGGAPQTPGSRCPLRQGPPRKIAFSFAALSHSAYTVRRFFPPRMDL